MARPLADKSIIITGASAGIGAATAVEAARHGMDVVLCARREDRLEVVAERVRSHGRDVRVVAGDVTDPTMSRRLLAAAGELGGVYAVFANAGYGLHRPMHETDDDVLREIFETNFFASVNLLRHAARNLIEHEQPGHLLMCSSCLARMTIPGHGHYCATKAAQHHVCRAMRFELRPRGIEVASVHPITTRTELFDVTARHSGREGPTALDRTPALFVQSPERVARAVLRCLRRPRPEVWTSIPTRLAAAALTAWPSLLDVAIRLKPARRNARV